MEEDLVNGELGFLLDVMFNLFFYLSFRCVAILDFNGNMTHSYRPHMHPIRQVKVDSSGEFIGTSSEDGNVIIYGLYTKETVTYSYGRPVWKKRKEKQFNNESGPTCLFYRCLHLLLIPILHERTRVSSCPAGGRGS